MALLKLKLAACYVLGATVVFGTAAVAFSQTANPGSPALVKSSAIHVTHFKGAPNAAVDLPTAEKSVAEQVARNLIRNDYSNLASFFDDTLKVKMTPDATTQVATFIHTQFGSAVSGGRPTLSKLNGLDVAYVPYKFQKGAADIAVVFDSDGKVGGLWQTAHENHNAAARTTPTSTQISTATTFADNVMQNRYDALSPELDDTMKANLSADRLSQIVTSLKTQVGDVVSTGTPRKGKILEYDVIYIPYRFQHGALDMKVVFDKDGKIGGLFFINHGGQ
jgi:hypothetical protein